MHKLIVDAEAYQDVDEIMAWHESQKQGLGIDFLLKFDEAVSFLKQNPFACQVEFAHFRRVLVPQFPYKVYYTIDKPKEQIQILAVFHQKQNPDSIQTRLGK